MNARFACATLYISFYLKSIAVEIMIYFYMAINGLIAISVVMVRSLLP
jgi:hypothetical protein